MLYLIEITKQTAKAFFGAAAFGTAETLPVSGKGVGKNGEAGDCGQGRSILKNTERTRKQVLWSRVLYLKNTGGTGKPVLWSRVLYLKNSFLIYLNVSFSPLSRSMVRRFSSSRAVSGCILSLACPRMK